MSNEGALANLDVEAAIEQLANGFMLKQIAAQYGVTKRAVYRHLVKHPDYKDAIATQAHTWVEDAMSDAMECDADTVNIARVRVDAAFKYAKAHNPAYRDQATLTHELGATFEGLLEGISKRRLGSASQQSEIIDVTPTDSDVSD